MKKIVSILLILLLAACLSISAFAAENEQSVQRDSAATASASETIDAPVDEATAQEQSPDVSESPLYQAGETGRGTVADANEYWSANGYPDYVSYACNVGGELLADDTVLSYWEIGVTNADKAAQQEILDLLAPTCLVTFTDCTYSYAQRIAALNAITALDDPNITQVIMGTNTEMVTVVLSDTLSAKQQKDYAAKFAQEYGSFISISDGSMDEVLTDGIGYDIGGEGMHGINPLWILVIVACVGAFFLLLQQRRLVPVAQAASGTVVTDAGMPSEKAVVDAVRQSQARPADDTFDKIMEKAAAISDQNKTSL